MRVASALIVVAAFVASATLVRAQSPAEITINDVGVQPENVTSSQDGAVYFGSTAKGTIYRAPEVHGAVLA